MLTGSQEPRYDTTPKPKGSHTKHGDLAIKLAAGYGLHLDPWQAHVVRSWLRQDKDGLWCASNWGVSVSRQNGKNAALEVVELYCMVALGLKFVHTSHKLDSARKAFKRLQTFFGRQVDDPKAKFPELNALVSEVRRTNSQESIELHNGARIELSARTENAGRGSSFDILVVDEAQQYEEDEQESLEPTISASPSGDPVVIYMGTPPAMIGERGRPFVNVRNAALTGKSKRTTWIEHSPSGDVDAMTEPELARFVADRHNWVEAIPALGGRLTVRTVEAEWEKWSARSFARERLNMFPSPQSSNDHPISQDAWDASHDPEGSEGLRLAAVGLDMNPERTKVTICMSYWTDTGQFLEVAADAPYDDAGQSALVSWVWERARRRVPVVIDGVSPAQSLTPLLKAKSMLVRVLGAREYAEACMGLHDAVRDREVSHFDQVQLNLSALGVVKAPMDKAGAWKFAREDLAVDLGPIIAATCAYYGAAKFGRRPKSEKELAAASPAHGFF